MHQKGKGKEFSARYLRNTLLEKRVSGAVREKQFCLIKVKGKAALMYSDSV